MIHKFLLSTKFFKIGFCDLVVETFDNIRLVHVLLNLSVGLRVNDVVVRVVL